MLAIRQMVKTWVESAISELQQNKVLPRNSQDYQLPEVLIEATKDAAHGDFATNFALVASKLAKTNPRVLAEKLVESLKKYPQIAKIEIAGPGFINFFLSPGAFYQIIYDIQNYKQEYAKSDLGQSRKVHLEFVSSNPTGPLHVGHGRHAAYGSCVANLLEHVGFVVHREYYINDAGRQVQILALSTWLRYAAVNPEACEAGALGFPSRCYQGDYVNDVANDLRKHFGEKFASFDYINNYIAKKENSNLLDDADNGDNYVDTCISHLKETIGDINFKICLDFACNSIIADMKNDLEEFGVVYDEWFSENKMINNGAVPAAINYLEEKGCLYKKDGAIWFKTSEYGDEKDRVLIRSNGQNTYFAPDIAYHLSKLERGYDVIMDILGSDHHGYIPRLRACLRAFNKPDEKFITKLVQFVDLYRGTVKVPMSTRTGSFVTLRELRNEVGNDATRFFYVARKVDQLMDFDIDLAKSQSNENPVYYIQYAHARICSITRQLAEKGYHFDAHYLNDQAALAKLKVLIEPAEIELLKHLGNYIDMIQTAALAYEPHRVVQYLKDLAHLFHKYYNAHPVIVEDDDTRNARICLILAVKQIIKNALTLLGISSPEKM